MPYSTDDKTPIQHDLFDRFLLYKEGTGKNIASDNNWTCNENKKIHTSMTLP